MLGRYGYYYLDMFVRNCLSINMLHCTVSNVYEMYDDDLGAVDAKVGDTRCLAQDVLRHAAVASLVILLKVSRHEVFLSNCIKLIPTSTLKIV